TAALDRNHCGPDRSFADLVEASPPPLDTCQRCGTCRDTTSGVAWKSTGASRRGALGHVPHCKEVAYVVDGSFTSVRMCAARDPFARDGADPELEPGDPVVRAAAEHAVSRASADTGFVAGDDRATTAGRGAAAKAADAARGATRRHAERARRDRASRADFHSGTGRHHAHRATGNQCERS